MVSKLTKNSDTSPLGPPGTTPEVRESQMIDAAINLAEQQIMQGTASSQIVIHFLKLGSSREYLEQERLREENRLLRAKVDQLASAEGQAKMYENALRAMRQYQGDMDAMDEEEVYDDGFESY